MAVVHGIRDYATLERCDCWRNDRGREMVACLRQSIESLAYMTIVERCDILGPTRAVLKPRDGGRATASYGRLIVNE